MTILTRREALELALEEVRSCENSHLVAEAELASLRDELEGETVADPRLGSYEPTTSLARVEYECWRIAEEHGWHLAQDTIEGKLLLIHSEISEAVEAFRDGDIEITFDSNGKPQGLMVELADAVIRIFDLTMMLQMQTGVPAASLGTGARAVLTKMTYNETRPYRHGGKAI